MTGENKKGNNFNRDYTLKESIPKNKFLIGIFWGLVWEHTNDKQYQINKEANVDYIQNVISSGLDTEEKRQSDIDRYYRENLF